MPATPRRASRAPAFRPALAVSIVDHLKFARSIARGVRADFGLLPGSQEEEELQQEAYLVVCQYAARFDPLLAYKRNGALRVEGACRAWRPSSGPPPEPAPVEFAGEDLGAWVGRIAGRVANARKFRRGSPGRLALLFAGLAMAAELVRRFDAGRAFRGWCSMRVRSECRRAAIRLQNGGTFHTTRDADARRMRVGSLPGPSRACDGHRDSGDSASRGRLPAIHCDTLLSRDLRRQEAGGPEDLDEPFTAWGID